ncbi:hypothetical protein FA95DRAFT_1670356 [Auriscalpium vulgare]|uniref:Uncharacterized protein n=1 Tax=Auriscalpium vulgare TaxID=40419 RepID=A0ACB8S9B8_9AGAM|nr:hypothetical protein FA95DRAFT_1670356 [Auriscalpium vulgare]
MAARAIELVSNGVPATFSFTDETFLVDSTLPHSAVRLALCACSGLPSESQLQVPLNSVIWADADGGKVRVHLLAKKHGRHTLVKVSGAAQDGGASALQEWAHALRDAAYAGVNQKRYFLVLVNPHGGPGKAVSVFREKVEPILRAAQCMYECQFTEYHQHATKIASEIPLDKYDAVICISGDGLVHEIFNGFSQHREPMKAFRIPIAVVPAGSGNGTCMNILGPGVDRDIGAATLNAIKGRSMPVDLCSILQDGKRSFSSMSQCVGLMAELDLGTEHLRWMGSKRFFYGFLRGLITHKLYHFSLSVKPIETDKMKMIESVRASRESSPAQRFEARSKEVPEDGAPLPPLRYASSDHSDGWITFVDPILFIYAGKGPYVSKDVMEFPVSLPSDGAIDIVIQPSVTRSDMYAGMSGAERGEPFWLPSAKYIKASAYRLKPLIPHGHLAIDGERFPFTEYLAEVHQGLGALLSMHGTYLADDFSLNPPAKKSSR